jgi:hypothetical protein
MVITRTKLLTWAVGIFLLISIILTGSRGPPSRKHPEPILPCFIGAITKSEIVK